MNALELADAVEPLVLTSFHETQYIGRKAADMLRKQHEAIKQLRGALVRIQDHCVIGSKVSAICKAALKDTEHLK